MNNSEIQQIKNLSVASKNPKVLEFSKYYQLWQAFFEKVLEDSDSEPNPISIVW